MKQEFKVKHITFSPDYRLAMISYRSEFQPKIPNISMAISSLIVVEKGIVFDQFYPFKV